MKINEIKEMKIKEDVCGIYSISNSNNGNTYIGSSIHIYSRWKEHVRMLEKGTHHQINLKMEFLELKDNNVYDFEIIETFDDIKRRELNRIEDKYILDFREKQIGYKQKTNREIYEEKGYLTKGNEESPALKQFKKQFYNIVKREGGMTTRKCLSMTNYFKKGKYKDCYSEMKLTYNNEIIKLNNVPITLGMLEFISRESKLEGLIIIGGKIITQYYKTSYDKEVKVEIIDNVFKHGEDFSDCIAIINSKSNYCLAHIKNN